ncbi:MAG: ABC transporter permease, partial [Blastocatellia bacterium]
RNLFAERSFLLLAVVFAILIVYGTFNAVSWINDRSKQSQALLAAQEKDLAEKKEKTAQGFKGSTTPGNFQPDPADPYAIGMSLQYAVLPFTSAAVFSLGQSDVQTIDQGVTISTLQRTKADKTGFENPMSFLAGRVDLSFIIVYLLPLFVFALSFNVLSGEREQGILQLLLSQPLKLKNLLAAKITAQFALICGLVSIVSLATILLGVQQIDSDLVVRTLLWLLLVAAYAAFWFALAVFINSFGLSSAANAVTASAAWLILVLILPSLLNVAISAAYPVPSRSELISAIRDVNLDMRRDGSRLLAEHYQDHPELMPKSGKADTEDFGLAFVYIQREQKNRVAEVEDRFAAQLAGQQSLVRKLRYLSPSIIAQEASNDIAGTGIERYQHFRAQVKEFDAAWADYFVPKIFRQEKLSLSDFGSIPRFAYREEAIATVAYRALTGGLFLVIVSMVLVLATVRKLASYRTGD